MSRSRIVLLTLLPGLSAPSLTGAARMLAAGVAWGVYSLRGKGSLDAPGIVCALELRIEWPQPWRLQAPMPSAGETQRTGAVPVRPQSL